jgi:hypothetical protein
MALIQVVVEDEWWGQRDSPDAGTELRHLRRS